ncbi:MULTISPECIES: signal peptide peptidase SppA [Comamonas]|uniref:signal peptide peptidase SppA n=1 Tax=Comamonas TaxID=283 RepID=UPI0015F85E61|nr:MULTISPECIES: signal peptide peptidase SppA [Comamonas]UUC96539.1 signal peptide peptidase SppA [Comamonas sp. C11]
MKFKLFSRSAPTPPLSVDQAIWEIHSQYRRHNRWNILANMLRAIGVLLFPLAFIVLSMNGGNWPWSSSEESKAHTAFVNVRGEIAAGSLADSDRLIPAIQKAFKNEHSKAIIIKINSPGGSPVPSGRIHDEILVQRAKFPEKKVYAVIDDIGASGGYYIAVSANEIYADRASLVGSIGVISSTFGFTGLMDKLGIERRAITAGEHKALLDPFSPLSPEIKKFWEALLAQTNEQFVSRVKTGRGERLQNDPTIFSGLIWNGEQAKNLGLIDGLGSMEQVASDVIGVSKLVDYTPSEDFFKRMSQRAKVEARALLSNALPSLR